MLSLFSQITRVNSIYALWCVYERVSFAHQKRSENMTVNEIALLLHSSVKTVQKYLMLDPDEIENRTIVKEKKHLLAMKQKQNEVN